SAEPRLITVSAEPRLNPVSAEPSLNTDSTEPPTQTVRFFSIFRLLYLILKGGLVGCLNQGSWSGSDQRQRYLLEQTRNITKYFLSLSIAKCQSSKSCRCRGLQEMVVLPLQAALTLEPRAQANLTGGITYYVN